MERSNSPFDPFATRRGVATAARIGCLACDPLYDRAPWTVSVGLASRILPPGQIPGRGLNYDEGASGSNVFGQERDLISAIRDGDRAAAETMVERTYEAVYASLHRLCGGDGDMAADLTQETYRKAWEAIGGFNGNSKIFTWLYRIAYTTFLNHVRGPRRIVSLDDGTRPDPVDSSPPADELIATGEDSAMLRKAVLALDDDLRFTVTARFWGDLPIREIARIEGITTVAIRKRLKKALRLIESKLSEE